MPKKTVNKRELSFGKSLLKELPYHNFRGDLVQLHGQFNNSILASKTTRNNLHKLTSLHNLSLFNLNTNLDVNLNPYENYYSIRDDNGYEMIPSSQTAAFQPMWPLHCGYKQSE